MAKGSAQALWGPTPGPGYSSALPPGSSAQRKKKHGMMFMMFVIAFLDTSPYMFCINSCIKFCIGVWMASERPASYSFGFGRVLIQKEAGTTKSKAFPLSMRQPCHGLCWALLINFRLGNANGKQLCGSSSGCRFGCSMFLHFLMVGSKSLQSHDGNFR